MHGAPDVRAALELPDDTGPDEAWAYMAIVMGQWALRGSGQWALEEKTTGTFVGRAGLHNPHRLGWPGMEVGWALHPDHWGRGYATEAGARAIAYAFDDLGVDRVCSNILPANRRSQAVVRRLGLTLREERVLPHYPSIPHGIWWITLDEWRQRQGADL